MEQTAGFGPATGRGRGYCTGYDGPGFMNYDSDAETDFKEGLAGEDLEDTGLRADYELDVTEEEERYLERREKEIERE